MRQASQVHVVRMNITICSSSDSRYGIGLITSLSLYVKTGGGFSDSSVSPKSPLRFHGSSSVSLDQAPQQQVAFNWPQQPHYLRTPSEDAVDFMVRS